jgi:SAM-dependent methyltransferase
VTVDGASDYFESQYPDYERQNPPRKLDHYLDVIDSFAGGTEEARVLDLGCGLGAFLERAHRRHPEWELFAVDAEPRGVAETAERVPSATVKLHSADSQSFPYGSIDIVTAWDVIEHVGSLDEVATSVDTMLKPTGLFFLVVPVYDGPLGPLVRALDSDPTHIHQVGRDRWLAWANTHFEVLDWHGIFRYLAAGRYYLHLPTRSLRGIATAILIVCRRRQRPSSGGQVSTA